MTETRPPTDGARIINFSVPYLRIMRRGRVILTASLLSVKTTSDSDGFNVVFELECDLVAVCGSQEAFPPAEV
jgi:hypothetical protein